MKIFSVYILSSYPRGPLYIGVTSNLEKRIYEHRLGIKCAFSKKYSLHRLVYYEQTTDVQVALAREKQLKRWRREWKNNLVEKMNPAWADLTDVGIPDLRQTASGMTT
ncbi:MAG: GIY-YIG nuclease family protein [Patescibacteria group bacterium]